MVKLSLIVRHVSIIRIVESVVCLHSGVCMFPTSSSSPHHPQQTQFFSNSAFCIRTHMKTQTKLLPCHHATNMILVHLLLFWLSLATNTVGQITAAPSCPAQADPWYSQLGLLVQKRDIRTYCDSSSKCKLANLSRSVPVLTYYRLVYCYQPAACVSGSDGCAYFLSSRVYDR